MSLAIEVAAPGGPEALRPVQRDVPALAPGEALVRHDAIGVNFIDVYYRTGLYPLTFPMTVGVEGAGIVQAVAPDVSNVRPGARVVYGGVPGAYAELRSLPAEKLIQLPEHVDSHQIAGSFLRGLTAHMLLHEVRQVKPGDFVLVLAGAGGLGQMILRWGRKLGATMIATVGSKAKIETAKAAGADHVLLHSDADWPAQARALSGGRGAVLVCDGVGGKMLARSMDAVRPFGILASLGQPAGPIPPIPVEELGPLRSISLARPSVMAYARDPERYGRGAAELLDFLKGESLQAPAQYPLVEAARAHADLEAGRTTGSIILVP